MKYFLIKKNIIIIILLLQFILFFIAIKIGLLYTVDFNVYNYFENFENSNLYDFFTIFGYLSGEYISVIFVPIIFLLLIKLHFVKDAIFITLFSCISVIGTIFLKYTLMVERPMHSINGLTGYSFPSGHAVLSMLLAISFYILIKNFITTKSLNIILVVILLIYTLLSMLSRIIVGAHWFTDIIGSIYAILIFYTISFSLFQRIEKQFNIGVKN